MRPHHKTQLDRRVTSALIDFDYRDVREITSEFIRQLTAHLVENGTVSVEQLGRFTVEWRHCPREVILTNPRKHGKITTRVVEVPYYIRVGFAKCAALKEEIVRHGEVRSKRSKVAKPRAKGKGSHRKVS